MFFLFGAYWLQKYYFFPNDVQLIFNFFALMNRHHSMERLFPVVSLVEDDERADDAGHPADGGKDQHNQEGAAALVDNRQRREDDG